MMVRHDGEYDWGEKPDSDEVTWGIWGAAIIALVFAGACALGLWLMLRPADAHSWFGQLQDPVTHAPCCTGPSDPHPDCQPVPPEMAGVVSETQAGYRITLTVIQAKYFNPAISIPIDEVVPYARVQPGMAGGFAICLWNNHVQCFFAPSNS